MKTKQVRQQDAYPINAGVQLKLSNTLSFKGNISPLTACLYIHSIQEIEMIVR